MSAGSIADCGTEILARVIRPQEGNLSVEAARSILRFQLASADIDKVNLLASRARTGTLNVEERALLDEYERVTSLIEVMQSKARSSLRSAGLQP